MTQTQSSAPPPPSLRQRILDELRSLKEQRLSVVPEQITTDGKIVRGVIVTDVGGHRFRILEVTGKLTLEQDKSPRAEAATWQKVENAKTTLKGAVGAMLAAMKTS